MGLYNEETDYQDMVNDDIERAKYLYNLSDEGLVIVHKLLDEKKKIMNQNSLFAFIKLNKIEKEIQRKVKKYRRS